MLRILVRTALLCVFPVTVMAQPAQPRISWQGLLTDAGGVPLAGPVNLEFKFYYQAVGGSAAWTFDTTNVGLVGGIANIDLPVYRGTPTPLEVERGVYLGVSINGTTELPRTPVRSAPSALTLKTPALIKGERSGTVTSSLLQIWNTGNGPSLHLNNTGNGSGLYSKVTGRTSLYAETSHSNGVAVEGKNTSTTGFTWGLIGRSESNLGTGVLGRAQSSTGATTGVYGISTSPDGFGGQFEGGRGISVKGHPTPDHGGYVTAYVGLFENTNGGVSDDGIAIKVGATGNPGAGANFIGFFDGDDDLIGQVEGNGTGGVTFNTSGADYAESLPIFVGEGRLEPGDVVGVHAGAVSRRTEDADQLLVVTDRAAIIGNAPKGEESINRVPVSFLGQVPVRMVGPVRSGDYVLSSGKDDGTAVAVPPSELRIEHIGRLLGRAWETSAEIGLRRINMVVGLDRTEVAVALLERQDRAIQDLQEKVEFLLGQLDEDAIAESPSVATIR